MELELEAKIKSAEDSQDNNNEDDQQKKDNLPLIDFSAFIMT